MNKAELTQQEFDECQQAGNAAYDATFIPDQCNLRSATEAYREAFDNKQAEILADRPRPGYIVNPASQLPEAQAMADAKMAEYAQWQDNAKDWHDIKGDCDL